jgi:hypothetical protein
MPDRDSKIKSGGDYGVGRKRGLDWIIINYEKVKRELVVIHLESGAFVIKTAPLKKIPIPLFI